MRKSLLPFAIMSLFSLFSHASPLEPGAAAPDVTAPDQDGRDVRFAEIYPKGITLVYFYPKADTPGCTAQACSLRDAFAGLESDGVTILGVSGDSPAAQKKFREKHGIPFTLIADTDGKVAEAFGVPRMMGISGRQSFLIKDGKIRWTTPKAKTGDHAEEVAAAIAALR
jgi:thioredoxin-dependent peroxiredoxin